MRKKDLQQILIIFMSLIMAVTLAASAAAAKGGSKEQFGEIKGKQVFPEPETTLVKENICQNPALCEAVEIDMLDQLQKSRVPIYLPPMKATGSTQAYQIAINLGITVTDTLAAIVNQDKAAVTKGREIINGYAKKLSTPKPGMGIYGMMTRPLDQGEWKKLGTLIYEFKDGITSNLNQRKQNGEAMLAVISGGMEGLYILAKSLDAKFSPDQARMLRKVEFVKFQEVNIKFLPENLQSKKEVKDLKAALPKIDKIVNKPKTYTFKQADVRALVNICEPLRKSLAGN